jgi:tRNA pseudouridine38-40 synthase
MAYDGTAYYGWQVQPEGRTVQGVLQHALSTLLRQQISVTGAGRTDTGVHASFFMAHFDLDPDPDPGTAGAEPADPVRNPEERSWTGPEDSRFLFRLNGFLPEDIVVYSIRVVGPGMHARFSATSRTYQYRISSVKPLFTRKYSHYVYGHLDLEEIGKCCKLIREARDYTSFSKLHTDVTTHDCRVMAADWKEVENGYVFEITADRFLRNMVRSLAGTLLDVGLGKISSRDFRDILEARDRGKAGQSAPACGLFLVDIAYEGL